MSVRGLFCKWAVTCRLEPFNAGHCDLTDASSMTVCVDIDQQEGIAGAVDP
jgi:hypothetical protein